MSPEVLTQQLNVFTTLSEKFISEFADKKGDDIQLLSKVLRDKVAAAPKRVDDLLKRMNKTNVQGQQMQMRSEERRVGKSVSVRVNLGGRRIIKKKKV